MGAGDCGDRKGHRRHLAQEEGGSVEVGRGDFEAQTSPDVRSQASDRPFEARQAIDEISGMFWKISSAIEDLKGEPSQKSLGFEARERARADSEYAFLYRAIADISDWHLEVQRRRRTGKGVWYAVVDITMWDDDRVGRSVGRFHQECTGKQAAVAAARKLLAQHADQFAENITVEAEVITDIEWQERVKQFEAD
ncbi:PAS domain-containing protein [Mesorhizobium sp. PAMC28654]|uniref:PAS domain-containing protein n=1 Tax=Mesorhizobium sp. PAMC28654 TaxID=2880934 RepID=UPI001D0B69A1|nr:PAS domain-containing protein [Mesorhizobium sp. PAMC28654]UDL87017.1 PAS domain-containing protein [Mesorhizobium sp. PAMC28654]